MARRNSDRIKRLIKIQRQKEKIAETDLAFILGRQRQNEDSVASVLDALGAINPLHSTFANHYTKRLSSLEIMQKKLQMHRTAQEKKMLTERVKADRLEDKLKSANLDEERGDQEEDMQDLLDLLGHRGKSSSW